MARRSVKRAPAKRGDLVLALDEGTTGATALVLDRAGRVQGRGYRELPQHYPQPGWVEHDADDLTGATFAAARTALAAAGLGTRVAIARRIAAIGITNQRETTLVWDRRTGRPIHRAIVWQCRRTAALCAALRKAGHGPLVKRRTGLVLDPYFSGTKLTWLLRHVRGAAKRAASGELAFGTVDTWLLWNMTGGRVHATDPTNASRTLLYRSDRLDRLGFDDALLDLFETPPALLPEVRPSAGSFGETRGVPGLPDGIPISGIAGDQQAALFGQACLEPGMTKNTYGTGSFVLMHVGDTCPEPVEGLLTTVGWTLADGTRAYALEGAVFVTGAAVQWLRDGLGIIERAEDVAALAATVPDTEGCFVVPAFTGLGSPWWDPYARGTIVGITRGTGRGHLARAVLEAISLQTRDVVSAMSEASGHPIAALKADGGAAANDLLLQLQADHLQVPVSRPVIQETTALGAAYLAGLAEGVWASPADITANWQLDATFSPVAPREAADALLAAWSRAVTRSRGWATDR